MIRSNCSYVENNKRCGKLTRARRPHKFCRAHTLTVTGTRRAIPHQFKKERQIRVKKVVEVPKKKKK